MQKNSISDIYSKKIKTKPHSNLTIQLPTGQITTSEIIYDDKLSTKRLAGKTVKPGTYEVVSYHVDDGTYDKLEGLATASIGMIVIHFSNEAIHSWEEVSQPMDEDDEDGPYPILSEDDLIEFLIYDHSFIPELENNLIKEIAHVKDQCFTDGIGTISEGKAINVYVGEVAFSHKLYWALDKNNEPVKLVGYFEYSSDDNDEEE